MEPCVYSFQSHSQQKSIRPQEWAEGLTIHLVRGIDESELAKIDPCALPTFRLMAGNRLVALKLLKAPPKSSPFK